MSPTRQSIAIVLVLLGLAALGICVLREGPEPTGLGTPRATEPGVSAAGGLRARHAGVGPLEGPAQAAPPLLGEVQPWPLGLAPEQQAGTGRVHVLLVNARGEPLPDHPIEVSWWKAFGVMGDDGGTTDAEGRFRTSADEPWHLDSVSVPTEETVSQLYHSGPFAADPEHPHEVRVVMPGGGLIRGQVLDSKGRPRTGLGLVAETVRTLPHDPLDHPMHIDGARTRVDAQGRFSLPVVTGWHTVRLKAPGLQAVSEFRVHLTQAKPIADLVFRTWEPRHGRTLRVKLAGPVPEDLAVRVGASTGVLRSASGVEELPLRESRTGRQFEDRTYEFNDLQGDHWEVTVSVRRGTQWITERHPVPPGAVAITVPAPASPAVPAPPKAPPHTIRIMAHRQDGTTSAPRVSVLRTYDLGVLDGPGAHTRKSGETHVHIRPRYGEVYLVVTDAGHAPVGIGPLRAATAPTHLVVHLPAAGQQAHVEVVDASGTPVDAEITRQPAWSFFRPVVEGRLAGASSRRGFHGSTLPGTHVGIGAHRTQLDNLGAQPWQVTAFPTDVSLPPTRGIVRAGGSLRLVLGEGYTKGEVFRGRVIDAVRRGPLAGVRIEAVTDDTAEGHSWATALSAPDGTFTLFGLPARRTRFRVLGAGWAFPKNTTLDLGAKPGPITFALHAARRLPVLVVDAAGAPLPGALVSYTWPDGTTITTQDQYGNMGDEADTTDLGGRVDLLGLPATQIVMFVERPEEPAATRSRHEVDLSDPTRRLLTLRHLK